MNTGLLAPSASLQGSLEDPLIEKPSPFLFAQACREDEDQHRPHWLQDELDRPAGRCRPMGGRDAMPGMTPGLLAAQRHEPRRLIGQGFSAASPVRALHWGTAPPVTVDRTTRMAVKTEQWQGS